MGFHSLCTLSADSATTGCKVTLSVVQSKDSHSSCADFTKAQTKLNWLKLSKLARESWFACKQRTMPLASAAQTDVSNVFSDLIETGFATKTKSIIAIIAMINRFTCHALQAGEMVQ